MSETQLLCSDPDCDKRTDSFYPLAARGKLKPRVCIGCNQEFCGYHLVGYYSKRYKFKFNKRCKKCREGVKQYG